MGIEKIGRNKRKHVLIILFAVYIFLTLGLTLLIREPSGKDSIQTVWLHGFNASENIVTLRDSLLNFLLFIPLGGFVGLISSKYKILCALLFGLFVSETIECSQLIWQLGSFDVNDLLFNTLGAFIGGFMVVLVIRIRNLVKKNNLNNNWLGDLA